jgi:hypothetical protein
VLGNLGIDAAGDIFVLPGHAEFSPVGQLDSSVTPAAITASTAIGARSRRRASARLRAARSAAIRSRALTLA